MGHKDIQLSIEDNDSNQCLYIFNKTEKIVHASYLITSLLSTQEPMCWTIREECHYLLRHVLPLKDIKDISKIKEYSEKINTSLFALLSLYEISSRSQILSEMNCQVIIDELLNLSKDIKSLSENKEFGYQFSQEELSLGSKYASLLFNNGPDLSQSNLFKRSIGSGNVGNKKTDKKPKKNKINNFNKIDVFNKNRQGVGETFSQKVSGTNNRREMIIKLIKDKGVVSIKDISDHIKDCSEKTIQRELLSLVQEGILVKEGERRWSTYRLK